LRICFSSDFSCGKLNGWFAFWRIAGVAPEVMILAKKVGLSFEHFTLFTKIILLRLPVSWLLPLPLNQSRWSSLSLSLMFKHVQAHSYLCLSVSLCLSELNVWHFCERLL
jgi:hypothetical protein